MKLKLTLLAAVATTALAGAASANPLANADLTFGYDNVETDAGAESTSTYFRGDSAMNLMGVDTDLAVQYQDEVIGLKAAPKFDMGNGFVLGGFAKSSIDTDLNELGFSYGATGEFVAGDIVVDGYLGLAAAGVKDALDADTNVYGVEANMDLGNNLDASVFYDAITSDAADWSATGVALGADWSERGLPLYTNVSYSKDDADNTKLGLTVTLPLGGKADAGVKRW